MMQENPKVRNKYLASMGVIALICLFYPIGTACFPVVFIIDGIIGMVYGKKYGNRRFLALFTFILLVGVVCLPFFFLLFCEGAKFD